MINASGRKIPGSDGRERVALDVVVTTGETPASGGTGSGDDPMPEAEGIVVGTGREGEEISGTGATGVVTAGAAVGAVVAGVADRAV
jgi:hypothetical protein